MRAQNVNFSRTTLHDNFAVFDLTPTVHQCEDIFFEEYVCGEPAVADRANENRVMAARVLEPARFTGRKATQYLTCPTLYFASSNTLAIFSCIGHPQITLFVA